MGKCVSVGQCVSVMACRRMAMPGPRRLRYFSKFSDNPWSSLPGDRCKVFPGCFGLLLEFVFVTSEHDISGDYIGIFEKLDKR
jgi:hypothetical protein